MRNVPLECKVLVAEPEERTRDAFVRFVRAAKYEVDAVGSGMALLDRIAHDEADIYISAITFPDTTIYDILQAPGPKPLVFVTSPQFDLAPAIEAIEIGAYDYLVLPPNPAEIRFALQRAFNYMKLVESTAETKQMKDYKSEIDVLKKALGQMQESYFTTLEALVSALDAREHETANHSKRVSAYALHLAQNMGLSRQELEVISLGSLLHDIGKIGVADAVLLKPGPLTSDEWVDMRRHPGIGFRILKDIRQLKDVSQIVLAHQEKFDGSGYPRRLKRDKIPIGARIFSVVDCLDAMTSDRPYRRATSLDDARSEIAKHEGTQFDPDIVATFMDVDEQDWQVIKQTLS